MTYPQQPYGRPQPPATQPSQLQQQPGPYAPMPAVILTPHVPASGMATASMVLGILGVLGGWCLLGIPCILAVITGHIGLSQTDGGAKSGRGQAVAGLILGYLFVAPAIVLFFMVIVGGLAGGAADPSVTPTP